MHNLGKETNSLLATASFYAVLNAYSPIEKYQSFKLFFDASQGILPSSLGLTISPEKN